MPAGCPNLDNANIGVRLAKTTFFLREYRLLVYCVQTVGVGWLADSCHKTKVCLPTYSQDFLSQPLYKLDCESACGDRLVDN